MRPFLLLQNSPDHSEQSFTTYFLIFDRNIVSKVSEKLFFHPSLYYFMQFSQSIFFLCYRIDGTPTLGWEWGYFMITELRFRWKRLTNFFWIYLILNFLHMMFITTIGTKRWTIFSIPTSNILSYYPPIVCVWLLCVDFLFL